MKRVMIVGQPGSGKSWLAQAVGARTGLPVHHMDMIHWKPGWVERPMAEKLPMARAVEDSEAWVFEGGFSRTYATRLARADTLLVLDVPLCVRAWRIFWRTLRFKLRDQTRPDLPENCPERFDGEFWHFIWRTRHKNRAAILQLAKDAGPQTAVHILRTKRCVARYLSTLDVRARA